MSSAYLTFIKFSALSFKINKKAHVLPVINGRLGLKENL